MIKLLGCIFVVSATTLLGFKKADRLEQRCSQLRDIINLLCAACEQLKYTRGSCKNIMEEINKREVVKSSDVVNKFLAIPEDEPFPIRWEHAVDSSDLVLDVAEYREIRSLSDILGVFSAQEQIATISGMIEFFKSRHENLESYIKKQAKLYKMLGVLSGMAVVIFLL